MQPLAATGNSSVKANNNLSTSISLSLIDEDGNDIPLHANADQPIELIIPRDPNVMIPLFEWQNVLSLTTHNQTFNLHFVNLSRGNDLAVSVRFQMRPLNRTRAYWLIYRLDGTPVINTSARLIDGWSLFCPSSNNESLAWEDLTLRSYRLVHLDLTSEGLYEYFVDNQGVDHHQSLVFGLRELSEAEMYTFCSNPLGTTNSSLRFDTPMIFSANYELCTYTSSCYYLDAKSIWQSDGLVVSFVVLHPLWDHLRWCGMLFP